METLQAIKGRRAIRRYLEVPVEWEKVGVVLEAGRLAPSAGNTQEWNFIVVTDPGIREGIAELSLDGIWMVEAPVHIVVIANTEKIGRNYGRRGERLYSVQDCSIAATQMMLAAHDQGLGTCWVGAFDEHALDRLLGIPETHRAQCILTLGYPDEKPIMPTRLQMESIVFINSFGNRIKDVGFVLQDYNVVGKAIDLGKELAGKAQEKMAKKREERRRQREAKKRAQGPTLLDRLRGKKTGP